MPIYNFNFKQPEHSIDNQPDFRSDAEKLYTPMALYNPDNPDIALVEREAEEMCNISGVISAIYLKTENEANVDDVWDEDANPVYESPKIVKGVWRPEPLANELTKFGVDANARSIISFSRAVILRTFHRNLREGDIIAMPQNTALADFNLDRQKDLLFYRVISAVDDGNYKYRWLYTKCTVEPMSGDSAWVPSSNSF